MAGNFPLEPALWSDTAVAVPLTLQLEETISTDIAVIGAGYAGLSTALHLAERGVKTVVIEAHQIGFGASGRNAGQIIPGLKHDPDELVQIFGHERGERLAAFSGGAADEVFNLIDRYDMDVARVRNGWIEAAHNEHAMDTLESRVEQWLHRGAPVRLLSRAETASLIGSDRYLGGWLDERGGALQPLSYARELARVAISLGASIYTNTPAVSLDRDTAGWVISTDGAARIEARCIVICTNGYSDELWPGLAKSIIPFNVFQIATGILPTEQRESILPGGQVGSDTRHLPLSFRLDEEGRLLLGGRGGMRDPESGADWAHIERIMLKMFPQLAGVEIGHRWAGRVAMTPDFLPHLHEPAPGIFIDIGCQSRGVGLQTAMGNAIAHYLATGDADALPLVPSSIMQVPLNGLNKLYVSAMIAWYRMRDAGM